MCVGVIELRSVSVPIGVDESGKPRTEVRLFKHGLNPTENGDFIFGDAEAASVMAHYAKHSVRVMVDLEHLSLDRTAPNFDPDARGRGQLELRNGELWLVGIKWTADGAERITSGKQAYVSPAFPPEPQNRVLKIVNVALTAMPATDDAMPLAASVSYRGNAMDPKQLKQCLECIKLVAGGASHADAMTTLALDIKTVQSVVKAIGGDPGADLGTLFATIQDFAKELADMAAGKKPDEKPAEEAPAEEAPAPDAAQTMRASGAELELLRAEASKLGEQVRLLTAEREARDTAERRALVAELVKLGRETPATAWADVEATRPRGMLAAMPMVELRERVALFSSAPLQAMSAVRPAVGAAVLSDSEQKVCAEMGCKPEVFAALKAQREAAR